MNKYTYSFISKCPNDGDTIYYTLEIETTDVFMVEDIIKHCTMLKEAYHESIADDLIRSFGGRQVLTATHKNLKIETTRHENNARFLP